MLPLKSSSTGAVHKRRRLPGACDNCKQRKIRCDSAEKADGRCTNCANYNEECTHSTVRKRVVSSHPYPNLPTLHPSKRASSIEALQVMPNSDKRDKSGAIHPLVQTILSSSSSLDYDTQNAFMVLSQHILHLEEKIFNLTSGISAQESPISEENSYDPQSNNSSISNDDVNLASQLKTLTISQHHARHFGPSSTMSLLGVALQFGHAKSGKSVPDDNAIIRRPQFWEIHPWELLRDGEPTRYSFPDQRLLWELIPLYFNNVNAHFPLLHRPTFEKAVEEGLYFSDSGFGALVLAVCAVASRYSDDPLVLADSQSGLSSGWQWFEQIRQCWRYTSRAPLLYDIQTICLALLYAHGTSQPEATWTMLGMGIRFAQDIGAHRRKTTQKPSIESELLKRCFWILVVVDALLCSFVGRPRATISDDYDLDFPSECDDEYWEITDSEVKFVQPPGLPSKISSFNAYIKLMEILEYAQRTLYGVDKSKRSRGPAQGLSDKDIVARLDSELNQWFENLPEHLKRTSCFPGTLFYDQSSMLHACYYHVRILVHRPFIPLPATPPLPSLSPSLEICASAARSCTRVLKSQSEQPSYLPFPQIQYAIFTSAILLLVNFWKNLKTTHEVTDASEDLKAVRDCISVLSKLEHRWTPAGRFCDVIRGLSSFGGLRLAACPQKDFACPQPEVFHPSIDNSTQGTWASAPLPRGNVWGGPVASWDAMGDVVNNQYNNWLVGAENPPPAVPYAPQSGFPAPPDSSTIFAMEDAFLQRIMTPRGEVEMDFGDLTILQWLQQTQTENRWPPQAAGIERI